jgi:imidazolonepropionase-like amidohydrolase
MRRSFGLFLVPFLLLSYLVAQETPADVPAPAPPRAKATRAKAASAEDSSDKPSIALTHVTLIDITGAGVKPNFTVIISGDRIIRVGKSNETPIPKNAQVVDANGRFLIPGLWDMHVHWYEQDYLPLFIANGVTGIRIMSGGPLHREWRKQVEAGKLLGPRMVIASEIVDGPKPFWPGSISVTNAAEGRAAVDKIKQDGADFVKVYSFLPRDAYLAIADESKKQGIAFEGHVPLSVTAEEASRAGQKSFEHLTGILPACSTRKDDLFKAAQADLAEEMVSDKPTFWGPHVEALRQVEIDTYSPEKATALFTLFKSNGTWQCPTLTLLHVLGYGDDAAYARDPRLRYMPPSVRGSWNPSKLYGETPEESDLAKKEFPTDLNVVGVMQQSGVGILAGTDTLNPYIYPGFSLHDELGFLVQAGLTPTEALQTATLNPARFLGKEKDLGTIESGKLADMVLLYANPLEDIGNTRKIWAVIYNGKFFDRPALDQMLAHAEAMAKRKSIAEVMMKTIQEKNGDVAVQQYRELKSSQPNAYDFGENELIGLGYQLIRMKRFADAIVVFELSVEVFPQSYNTYDSLAEAYTYNGARDRAIQNYRKSLELNPQNTNAVEKLKSFGVLQ